MSITQYDLPVLATRIMKTLRADRSTRKFPLGGLTITPGAMEELELDEVLDAVCRHARGDWGDVCEEDQQSNEEALAEELRLFSAYHSRRDQKFWIITEADRSTTTVLLPSEY